MSSYNPDKYKYSNRNDRSEDVSINIGDIYYALNWVPVAIDNNETLKSKIASVSERDVEFTSLDLLDDAATLLADNNFALDNLFTKLNNTKNILINFDTDAKYFWQFVDTGVLDETLHYTSMPEFDQTEYNQYYYYYGKSEISGSGCGLCAVTAASSWLFGSFMAPGQYNFRVAEKTNLGDKLLMAGTLQGVSVDYVPLDKTTPLNEQLSGYLSEGSLIIALVPAASSGLGSDHFILITNEDGEDKFNVVDSYKGKNTGHHTVGSQGIPGSETGEVDIRTDIYVVNPYKNVGNAEVAHTTISVGKEVMDQIAGANEQINPETGMVEKVELNPKSQNAQSYMEALEDYNNRERTYLPENTPRDIIIYDPETNTTTSLTEPPQRT